MRSVELFVGAGGLALGVSRAGFKHTLVADWDHDSCETIRHNQDRGVDHVAHWPLFEGDVRGLDFADIPEGIDLLAGGPPCQPFSIGGKHRAYRDERDMFPQMARAVRTLRPRAVLVENVRGLARASFAKYFSYILLQLTYPELAKKAGEQWTEHQTRLERHHTRGRRGGLYYRVVHRVLNAADYGVPQSRERVVIVAFRADLGLDWSFPEPTHTRDALLNEQFVTGEYWERHHIPKRRRPEMPAAAAARVDQLRNHSFLPLGAPWRTVRDALADLPEPSKRDDPPILNHRFMPGARPYVGHTGSPYDLPAKTLKAGDHGVPGGENMLVMDDGSVRYFSVREAARLQTFPDDYAFSGAWSENMRQIGNAVPVRLGELIARDIRARLDALP
jgi:DNA (cytosine-5)-methyltransferase 1